MRFLEFGPEPFANLKLDRPSINVGGDKVDAETTDAVIEAVRRMQKMRASDTSIMGNLTPEDRIQIAKVDKLVHAVNTEIACCPQAFGPAGIVKWANFVADWMQFKDDLSVSDRYADMLSDQFSLLKASAIAWGRNTVQRTAGMRRTQSPQISAMDSQSRSGSFSWKTVLFLALGSVAAFIGIRLWVRKGYADGGQEG